MKGIIFTVFNKMVEEKFGLNVLENIINESNPPNKGAYTSGTNYPDNELISLILALSNQKKLSIDSLVFAFGQYLIFELHKKYPVFFEEKSLKEFLISVDSIIHVEVKKIYPDAELPVFKYSSPDKNTLIMKYYSKRKMCTLAEGLINGASLICKKEYILVHDTCCKKGSDHCVFEITFKE